jgi:hypothetical protein
MAFKNLHAQTPCNDITVTVIEPSSQSGPHNYYGVRVSLAQTYGETITVSGYIYDDGDGSNYNTNHPFTLTIYGGTLSDETSALFYETSPTSGAAVTIASVTPCPEYTRGNDIDLGTLHNQVVDYIDSYDFTGKTDSVFFDEVFYYATSIIDPPSIPNARGIWGVINFCGKADPAPLQNKTIDSVGILLEQADLISSASRIFFDSLSYQTETSENYDTFMAKVNQIASGYNIAGLPLHERLLVQGALSTFTHSAEYWKNYFTAPDDTTTTDDPQARFTLRLRCFWCVAKRDIVGALIGFLAGNCICGKLGVANPWICGAVGAVTYGALCSWAAKVCPDVCHHCKKPSSYPSWLCRFPFIL